MITGPTQPSRHSRPLAASMSTARPKLDAFLGWVPARNSSLTVLVVDGPGRIPVKASTVAVTRPLGRTRPKPSIGMPLETSDRIALHSGPDVSSESRPSLGELSELPSQTPATSPGSFLFEGGAR